MNKHRKCPMCKSDKGFMYEYTISGNGTDKGLLTKETTKSYTKFSLKN